MSSPQTQTTSDLQAVADAFRSNDRFLLVTHENPDGDALGSLLATKLALDQLGKDSVMYLYGDAPLPKEYGFMELGGILREPPRDAAERVLVAVDCANETRMGPELTLIDDATLTLDIDHHHDNSRFGDVNLVVGDASSTGEVLRDVFAELGVELTPEIAEALYTAVVTDTGRFQYSNTTPKALRLAADLVEAGADVHRVFQDVYESVEFAKLKLLARALERAEVYEGGRLVVSHLLRSDFTDLNVAEAYSEGIIDDLRAVDGAEMAALIREPPRREGPPRRVSLRASNDELDVSAIARKSGGGGHRQAAGFSSDASIEEITEFIHREFRAAAGA
jgi:phosphoesterase RecJ-like protein